ncbi:MAG: oligosaccharide flippase family protein [Candidatus Methanoperedens sp.]|nr:oligosaccharide flippase family protein [Candidatus Methanoperedens sp.]
MEKISVSERFFLKDELARNSAVMFAATIIAGAFNYLYQVYMGRVMGPEEYGIFGALFAIFYMIGIIAQTLGTSATRFVSGFTGEGKQIGFFLTGSLKRMALVGLLVSLIFVASSGGLASLLRLPDRKPILILAPILLMTWISPISSGALRGVKRFPALGFVNISSAVFKLVFGVALVILGFGVSGALAGVAAGMLAALAISLIFLKPYFKPNNPHEPDFRFTSFYSYSLPVMLAMFAFSVPANLDVVLAKYFFSATDAGLYTSASVLGKIIFFFPAGIYAVMFPMIAERHARGEDTKGILKKSLAYTAALSGPVALAYLLFPQLVVKVFGTSYAAALPLVAPYGLAMFFFSLTVIVMHYHLAIKNLGYVALFVGLTFVEVLLLSVFNSSVQQMVEVLLAVNTLILFVSLIYTWRWKNGIDNSADV